MRAFDIKEQLKMAAGMALEEPPEIEFFLPQTFDEGVGKAVAKAVTEAAKRRGQKKESAEAE